VETLQFSVKDQIATLTFNRPEAMNSFNQAMAHELKNITQQIKQDNNIRAVILNGAGKLFMAGGDLKFFYDSLDTMPKGVLDLVRALNTSILNLTTMPKPVIASVHGSVAGAGMSLMMACDLVMVANDTKFTLAYSGIGVSPDGGATYHLPRLVGRKKAMEWLLLSNVFDAQTALHYGLINWVVPAEKLTEETEKLAKKLAHGPTKTYAHIKRLINSTSDMNLETQLEEEGFAFEFCTTTEDFKSGVTGFLQKKIPEFVGK